MIIVALRGGLGNQMFQYAAAQAAAARNETELAVDSSWFHRFDDRQLALGLLRTELREARPNEIRRLRGLRIPFTGRLRSLVGVGYPSTYFRERGTGFDPSFESIGKEAYLDGHFQSWRYFESARDSVVASFAPRTVPSEESKRYLRMIRESRSVSVHIRRGDYATNPTTRAFHGLCGREYYHEAVARVLTAEPTARLFLFSDDPDWVEANLKFDVPTVYVRHGGEVAAHEDLYLMSLCTHNIVANSTYSWWSAYLNENPTKVVVAPRQWFAGSDDNADDLVPSQWERL